MIKDIFTSIALSLIMDISMALITGVILSADGNGKNKTKKLLLGYLDGFLLKVKNTVECILDLIQKRKI